MNQTQVISEGLRGQLRYDVPMSKHTSWRAGGLARCVYQPADLSDLQQFLATLPQDEPRYVVGLGSNLLVRDGGFAGTIILMHGALKNLVLNEAGEIEAEAGVAGAKLARFAALNNLVGAEFFAGIPGTVGGMLAMNAGCYGGETWKVVKQVVVLDMFGKLTVRTALDYDIAYRHVSLLEGDVSQELFVAARFNLPHGNGELSRQQIKELLAKRIASQPLQLPNAGSVFRNPEGDFAARLIESCGLKGKCIGGACVSEKHANFIVNDQQASARDIEMLIKEVQQQVVVKTGKQLICEVRIIGEQG